MIKQTPPQSRQPIVDSSIRIKLHAIVASVFILASAVYFLISASTSQAYIGIPSAVTSLSTKADFVTYLYRCMLDKEPDQAGLDYWVGTMGTDPDPVNHLYRAFYQTSEFNKQISNTDFVNKMYYCVLFRYPNDPPDNNFSGRDFWVNQMNSGTETQSNLLEAFLGSTEYKQNILPTLSALKASSGSTVSVSLNFDPATALSQGTFFQNYVTASGGTSPYNFAVTSGALPSGLVLTSNTISGTPSQVGSFPFTVTATDIKGNKGLSTFILTVSSTSSPTSPTYAPIGNLDSIVNGIAYGWSLDKDTSAESNTVRFYIDGTSSTNLVGTTTANQVRPDVNEVINVTGNHGFAWAIPEQYKDGLPHTLYAYGVDLTNTSAASVQLSASPKTFTINAAGQVTVTMNAGSTLQGVVGQNYSAAFSASGGTSPYTFKITSGSLPGGLTLSANGLACTSSCSSPDGQALTNGIPTQDGQFNLTLTAEDSQGRKGSTNFTLTFNAVVMAHPPTGYLDSVYNAVAYGWAYDPDSPGTPITVHFYIDGTDATHLAGFTTADQLRSDVNQAFNISGDHGFAWAIPDQYKDGQAHTLYAFGIDSTDTTGKSNKQLLESPKTFFVDVSALQPIAFPNSGTELINSLYHCILNQAPSDQQLSLWLDKFNADGDLAYIYRNIYGDPNFGARHLSNREFIRDLYYCVLFRPTDPAVTDNSGYNFWLDQVDTGRTWESTLEAFLQSTEFNNTVLPNLLTLRSQSAALNLDPHLGVTHMSGFYPNFGPDFMVKGAQDARNLGFQGIELYMAPEICAPTKDSAGNIIKPGGYQTLDWCDSRPGPPNISPDYHSLGELAANPRYQAVFNMGFKNYFLTAETVNPDRVYPEPSDCVAAELNRINVFNVDADCYKNGFSARQLQSLHDDFYSLASYLLQTYAHTGKTFVLMSGNELENHFEASGTYPDWAMNNMVSYLNTVSQAIADAKANVGSSGVSVYHGCEFAVLDDSTLGGARDGVNNVVPRTHCDLYGWSAWNYTVNHPDDPSFISRGLEYFASKAPDSAGFGKHNIFLSEYGSNEKYHPASQNLRLLNDGIDAALALGAPYINYWQLYDNSCDVSTVVFPVTSEGQCPGFWLRKPASDPTQLGPLSDIYTQVFLPRKQ